MSVTYENGNHTKMVTYEHMVMWTYENGDVWKMVTYVCTDVTFLFFSVSFNWENNYSSVLFNE